VKGGEFMGWFTVWWQSLGFVGQVMACAAIPMTVVMLLQLLLMIIGVGFGGDSDGDIDGDDVDVGADNPANEAGSYGNSPSILRIFTIRGIVAFFALGGWAGLAALSAGIPILWSIQIAVLCGAAALLLASIVIRLALRMQDSGNINIKNALSLNGDVYITIPPSRKNIGKVTMVLQERFVELDAVTDSESEIRPNTKVEVIGFAGKDCLVVRPVSEQLKQT
jgi:hypothetical protein